MTPWNKGKTKEEFPQMSNSGVKKGYIPWNLGRSYSLKHEAQFKKGVAPALHKEDCKCFRCGGKRYDPTGRKQSTLTIAKRSAKMMGHKGWTKTKFTPEEFKQRRSFREKQRELMKLQRGSHTQEEWLMMKSLYKYMCLSCKKTEPEIKLTEDHIIPLSKGGGNTIQNIQPLCRSCNARKHTQSTSFLPSSSKQLNHTEKGLPPKRKSVGGVFI